MIMPTFDNGNAALITSTTNISCSATNCTATATALPGGGTASFINHEKYGSDDVTLGRGRGQVGNLSVSCTDDVGLVI